VNCFKLAMTVAVFPLLMACGGGGGGGSSPAGTTGGSTGGGTSSNTVFPTSFSSSFEENSGPQNFLSETFKFNAPSDAAPTNIVVAGADASFFEILIEAGVADSIGDRDITVTVLPSASAPVQFQQNFEFPQDEDRNNVYEFSFSATYNGRNISSDISISVTDVLDQAEVAGRFLVGEVGESGFGTTFTSIPDITGDGRPEIGALASGFSINATKRGFIFGSETLEGSADVIAMNDPANHLIRFLDQVPQSESVDNLLSAQENADGSVDIMVSQGALNEATVYHLEPSQRDGSFTGDLTLGVPTSSSYVIDFDAFGTTENQARLVDDLNGDGVADIFIQPRSGTLQGIMFGHTSNLGTTVARGPDIGFQQPSDFGTNDLPQLNFRNISDVNADGIDDFIIVRTSRVTFISGTTFNQGISNLDLDNLTPQQGFSISGIGGFRPLGDVVTTTDFDGDGFLTLAFVTDEAGGGGISMPVIDTDDFLALASNPTADAFADALRSVSPGSGTYQEGLLVIGDRTGDGIEDLLVFRGPLGDSVDLISGTAIENALNSTAANNVVFQVPAEDIFEIELDRFNENASVTATTPVFLPEADLLVFGSVCDNAGSGTTPCSGIGVFPAGEIDAAIAATATGLLFRSAAGLPF